MRTCSTCGSSFRTERPRAVYCSDKCRQIGRLAKKAAWRARQGVREKGELSRCCLGCGGEFATGSRERNKRKWCSEACRLNAYRSKLSPERNAAIRDRTAARHRETYVPSPGLESTCLLCGAVFVGRLGRLTCSSRCRHHLTTRRRRAKIKAVISGPYTVAELRKRDGDACSICAELIDFTIRHPDSRCWSFDHVVPLSMGGSDTIDNIALAHFGCNSRKGGTNRNRRAA